MANVYIKTVSGGENTSPSATDAVEIDDGVTSEWTTLLNLLKGAVTPGTSGNLLTSDGTNWTSAAKAVHYPRVGSAATAANPAIDTNSYDAYKLTAQAGDIASFTTNLSGTPVDMQELTIRIKDNGTPRAIAWGGSFEAMGVALPTTTVTSKRLIVKFVYDSVSTKWGCVASNQEA